MLGGNLEAEGDLFVSGEHGSSAISAYVGVATSESRR
jgi:hypothetical protein